MARIDHVALETEDPDDLAGFYQRVFSARIVKTEGHPVMAGRVAACPRSGPVEGVWGNREVPPATRVM